MPGSDRPNVLKVAQSVPGAWPTIPALTRLMSSQATFEPVSAKTQPVSGHRLVPIGPRALGEALNQKGGRGRSSLLRIELAPFSPRPESSARLFRCRGKRSGWFGDGRALVV